MEVPVSSVEITIAINTIWVLLTAFLVFFMQPGFAMLTAGLTRAKNVGNILMKNLMDFCMSSLGYWAVGFALMYGVGNFFLGRNFFFLQGIAEETSGKSLGQDQQIECFSRLPRQGSQMCHVLGRIFPADARLGQ